MGRQGGYQACGVQQFRGVQRVGGLAACGRCM